MLPPQNLKRGKEKKEGKGKTMKEREKRGGKPKWLQSLPHLYIL